MFFVNMLGENGIGSFRENTKFIFTNEDMMKEDAVLCVKENNITIGSDGKNLLMKGLTGEPGAVYNEKISKTLTIADVTDSAQNPLIACLCDEITVYDGISADIKYVYLGQGHMLVMLIYGRLGINGKNLIRCKEVSDIKRKSKVLKAKDLAGMSSFIDSVSGYNYIRDGVMHVRLSYSSKSESLGYLSVSADTEFFSDETLLYQRKRAEERKRIEEERKRRLEEEKKEKERLAEEARLAEIEKEKERVRTEASIGAAEFLKSLGLR